MRPEIAVLERIHADGLAMLRDCATVTELYGLPRMELLGRLQACDAVIVKSVTRVDAAFLAAAPRLRVVGRAGTGLDNIDLAAAEGRGIPVLSTPGLNANAAAELTIALALAACRHLPVVFARMAAGDFRRHLLEGVELQGRKIGVLGLGRVGLRVAQLFRAFGSEVLGYDVDAAACAAARDSGIALADAPEAVLRHADILSLHLPLSHGSRHFLSAARLALLPAGALVLNTARGGLVDDQALLQALDRGHVGGYACDVLEPEPPFDSAETYRHPLFGHARVIVTPHVGASTVEAQRMIALSLAGKLRQFLQAE